MNLLSILLGKLISSISRLLNLGHGSTWPGHLALSLNDNFINEVLDKSKTKTILVIGTNGKTTTSKILQTILETNHKKVINNSSGANLLNGVASSLILKSTLTGKINFDYAIFEIDENTFPQITNRMKPDFVVALNLFRDQLDRYGEVDTIAKKWKESADKLNNTTFILNSDDAQIAYLGKEQKNSFYFGLNRNSLKKYKMQHASDSVLCPNCGNELEFKAFYFSHLGIWSCPECNFKRPKQDLSDSPFFPLKGTYAKYDTLAAVLTAKKIGLDDKNIKKSLKQFNPAFGRQELIVYKNKKIELFLSKNPTSFNESLSTMMELKGKNLIIELNDKIPDGLDVSWIWDVDFEQILNREINISLCGERVYDMAIRMKYAGFFVHVFEDTKKAIDKALENLDTDETLYILPTYSAMLEIRKILTGKKIL